MLNNNETMCTTADHERIKNSPAWNELPLRGVQEVPGIDDCIGVNAPYRLELRDCNCKSTIARVCK
jgi:hypothetical protein